ncbi:hypothetical protein Sjap_002888 [Stephania japonica]|uniref:Uncharacterized protein n=1 Tax=Stephania japonica TaxID=461633 RepID=A0AAP0PSZ4_9MAGN
MATTLNLGGVKSMDSKGRDEVHVAAMPLRATKGPAQLLFSSAYSLNLWDLQHYMVIVRPYSPSQHQAFVFDFQPEDPENIYTALAALSGRGIPGTVLERKIACLPKSKCWFVGYSDTDAIERAKRFNECWDTALRINQHDCRNYTNDLVECLTGQKHVLEHLRS